MIVINKRKKLFFKFEDVYFAKNFKYYNSTADIVTFYQSSEKYPGCKVFHTLHIDILSEEETIFSGFDRRTKNDLLKSEKNDTYKTSILFTPSLSDIESFCSYFDEFAASKGIGNSDKHLLKSFGEKMALTLSIATDTNGNTLCMHAHSFDNTRARAIYSCSHVHKAIDSEQKNLIARSNRSLHWLDIKAFKQKKIPLYDFGGLTLDKTKPELTRVDEFKMGFGGKIVTEYHFHYPLTFPGRLLLSITRKNNDKL